MSAADRPTRESLPRARTARNAADARSTRAGRMRCALPMAAAIAAAVPLVLPGPVQGATPSFSCRRAGNAAERLICNDEALATLDRKMADVYGAATRTPSPYTDLNARQREWTRARNDCWQALEMRGCLEALYVSRIAELQVRYRLVPAKGPIRYACSGERGGELKATFFATDPPTAMLEYDGESLIAALKQPKGPPRYETRDVSFRDQNGEAALVWGKDAKEMRCSVQN